MALSTNRRILLGLVASSLWACAGGRAPASASGKRDPVPEPSDAPNLLAELEASIGGRVGVHAVDTASGRHLSHRPDERFAMCSTFKWALAAAVLGSVDRGELALHDEVPFSEGDLLDYAPVSRERLAQGRMTIDDLAEAAVTLSDNTAANLLLDRVGGPAGLTRFLREHGDDVTRLDRTEPTLNTNLPDDPRDTTTPRAMVGSLRNLLLGPALSPNSKASLVGWLEDCRTCDARLRAGLPAGWRAADKTGTGERGAVNDVGILWPPAKKPIVIAAYLSGSDAPLETLSAAHAAIARIVAHHLS